MFSLCEQALEEVSKKDEKVEVLELDELYVNLKKHLALDRGKPRHKADRWFSNWNSRNKTLSKTRD